MYQYHSIRKVRTAGLEEGFVINIRPILLMKDAKYKGPLSEG